MKNRSILSHALCLSALCLIAFGNFATEAKAQDAISKETISELDKALVAAGEGSSDARRRLAVKRVIRDAEKLTETHAESPSRFLVLEFSFRAYQQLIALDDDSENRKALLETARELAKAPDELAELRLEADLLLSQAGLAKEGANAEARAEALRPFVARYIDTPVGAKVLRLAMVMALELGDSRLVTDLQEMIEERFATDLDMISFQRDKLGGQVLGAPFTGTFKNSQGKAIRYPMDALGRSTLFIFWSNQEGGAEIVKGIAAAYLEQKEELAGRLEIVSFNLDELPDAGESFVRGLGVEWQVLHLPGGRKNPIYEPYVRSDPKLLTLSPTGYTALIMSGTTRQKANEDGEPDYGRMFGSMLARQWTNTRYVTQLASLFAGDFLVIDPKGGIDPTLPPELKAQPGTPKALARTATSVPEDTLRAIQDSFIAPPLRYRATYAEIRASYAKAAELSRKAIAAHPSAPDLWIVRNRLIVALLGLWKSDSDLTQLDQAVAEAKTALAAGFPPGCEVVARFCVSREALRQPEAEARTIIDAMVADFGGDSASGPALAAAALLSLEVADRKRFEDYRGIITKDHTENPMMWTFSSFLLDRYHRYWMFQVPFTAGWSFGRRENYFMSIGDAEESQRKLQTELLTAEGKPLRIPEDLGSAYTVIQFTQPAPWSKMRDDGLPASPERAIKPVLDFAATRPDGDVKVMLATFSGDPALAQAELLESRSKLDCPVVSVPGGLANPIIHRLGILSEDTQTNSVLLDKHGRVLTAISGLTSNKDSRTLINVIARQDEQAVDVALEKGEIDKAKQFIMALAPPFDPEAVDEKGRKITKKPDYNLAHLRARAQVYIALKDWDKALADAEEVVARQIGTDGGMSLRTDELDEAEALRDRIRELSGREGETQ
jgi:tetratricopeptide (TPR) repeat protein